MRVFIYEYICGGGFAGQPLPDSLAREGWAMLASIVEDVARVEGCEVVTTLDERLIGRRLAAHRIERLEPGSEQRVIRRLAAECDWTLVIAPEFDGILLDRVRTVEEAGGRLLGPSSSAVAATADKFACGRLLEQAGVPAVAGQVVNPRNLRSGTLSVTFPAVLKPRDGAGSQNTFLIRDATSVDGVLREAVAGGLTGEALLQPFVPGLPASVSLLIGSAGAVPLLAGEQMLSNNGRFTYLGGRLPLAPEFARRAVALASQAVTAVPGLRGYVGVDLVLGLDNLKSQISDHRIQPRDTVIEINPRFTTSYVGLRTLARCNLAQRMLAVSEGQTPQDIDWLQGTVRFWADGRLAYYR